MNYLKEIVSFEKWRATLEAPLNAAEVSLWYTLMWIFNSNAIPDETDCFYWPVWVTLSNETLMQNLKLTYQNLWKARNRLMNLGRLETERGAVKGKLRYSLVPFDTTIEPLWLTLPGFPDGVEVWPGGGFRPEEGEKPPQEPSVTPKGLEPVPKDNRVEIGQLCMKDSAPAFREFTPMSEDSYKRLNNYFEETFGFPYGDGQYSDKDWH